MKTIAQKVLAALTRNPGGLNSDRLAKMCGARGDSVSSICSRLRNGGFLKRSDGGGGRGSEAVWLLTAAGKKLHAKG